MRENIHETFIWQKAYKQNVKKLHQVTRNKYTGITGKGFEQKMCKQKDARHVNSQSSQDMGHSTISHRGNEN
jgi:hypothetical protein